MSAEENRRVAGVFGLLGGGLLVLDGVVDGIGAAAYFLIGRSDRSIGAFDHAFVLVVVGLLLGFFALFGRSRDRERGLAAGSILVVFAIVGYFVLGFGSSVLSVIGSLLALVGGILFLVSSR